MSLAAGDRRTFPLVPRRRLIGLPFGDPADEHREAPGRPEEGRPAVAQARLIERRQHALAQLLRGRSHDARRELLAADLEEQLAHGALSGLPSAPGAGFSSGNPSRSRWAR